MKLRLRGGLRRDTYYEKHNAQEHFVQFMEKNLAQSNAKEDASIAPKTRPISLPRNAADGFLAAIVESADMAIVSKDLNGIITSWNRAAERLFGYRADEIIGRPVLTIIPPERTDEEDLILSRIRKGESVEHLITVRRRKDGSSVEVSLTVSPIKDASGVIVGASKIVQEIDSKTEALGKAAANERQLRLVIEAAPNGMVMVDQNGIILIVNSQMERLFGYGRSEMVGRSIEMLLPERYRAHHPGQRQSFFSSPETRAMGHGRDLFARRKDGSEFAVEVGLNPAETPEGTFVVAAVIDITERKRIEQALAKTAAQFKLVVESAPNGMVMVDEHGVMVMVNSQMERLFGYKRVEMLGEKIEMLLPERYHAKHPGQRQSFFHAPATRAMGHGRDLFARRKDGSEFPVEVGLNPAETPEGTMVLAAVIDITQRKMMEADLAKAHAELAGRARDLEAVVAERTAHLQQTIAELEGVSYSLSHDMRAPLRTIRSFSQIVLAEAKETLSPEHREFLQKTINSAGRLDRLIQDVLIYSRIARESIHLTPVNVEQLLRQIIAERPEFQPPKAEITINTPLDQVKGHEAYLTQCVTNLLDNATKFVAPGTLPKIRIWSETRDGYVRIWFEDNGIGIPEHVRERVFGIFERVHDEKAYPGTGIGLAIVRKAAERMGGGVGIESDAEKGSRFWVQLPPAS